MCNNIEIIRKEQLKTTEWSGGTTTQLMIYPHNSEYGDRNFLWRLSSAKVDVEESVFTHLPGYERLLMIIDGELRLEHEGHHKTILGAFDQDRFSGAWSTKAYGRVTDFNLMMGKGCDGELKAVVLKQGESFYVTPEASVSEKENINAFYVTTGAVVMELEEKEVELNAGDFAYLKSSAKAMAIKLMTDGYESASIIWALIYF